MNAEKVKLFVIVLTLSAVQAAWGDSAQTLVRRANKLYEQGHFNDAIKQYDEALLEKPQILEPKFNKANCYYQLDDLAQAIDLYNEVAAESKDMSLVARAKYNLGNSYFRRGSRQQDSDLQKALDDMQTSIVQWRQVLDIEPDNENAAKNIEVARLIMKDIIDQINKQKQQQQQQAEQQKQLQEQLKQLLDRQKSLAEQTQQTQDQAGKGQIDEQQASDDYNKQADEQSQLKTETEQTSQQMQQQDPNTPQPPQMQQAAEELEQAAGSQAQAEQQLKASDSAAAKQSQDKAAEHLENALKALSEGNNQSQQQQQEQQSQSQQQQQGQEQNQSEPQQQQQSQQEQQAAVAPDTTAQEILDKEQRQKEQRQMLQRTPYQKVEKDW